MLDDKAAFSQELLADQPNPPRILPDGKKPLTKLTVKLLNGSPGKFPKPVLRRQFEKAKKRSLKIIDCTHIPEVSPKGFPFRDR